MAYAYVNHKLVHALASKTVTGKGDEKDKLCAAVAGMAIVGQKAERGFILP